MEPIKFEPVLKQTLWGGDEIIPFKHMHTRLENVGESWEISGVHGSETLVANGPYKGYQLNTLVDLLKEKLVGKENYERFGAEFPLLIKFIPTTRLPTSKVRNGERRRCGTSWILPQKPSFIVV